MDSISRYRIGRLEVDESARRVSADGVDAHLEPKVFDLLACLVRRAGQAVTHDELLAEVWGRHVASDSVIAQPMRKLRQLLADPGGMEGAITTLYGVGYRLDVEVEWLDRPNTDHAGGIRWQVPIASAILIAGLFAWWQAWHSAERAAPRVAILELESFPGDAGLDWVQAGIPALIAQELLGRGVEVLPRAQYREIQSLADVSSDPAESIASLFGVQGVFAPRLFAEGESFRLEIVNLAQPDAFPLTIRGDDPASLSLAAAALLAQQLRAPMPQPGGAGGLDNAFLNEAYARAYHHQERGQYQSSRELFEYVLRESPEYHWARYQLAITLRMAGDNALAMSHLQSLRQAGMANDWLHAAVLTTLGNQYWYTGDLEAARELYLEARRLFQALGMAGGVASTLANLGMLHSSRGEFERGEVYLREALGMYQEQGHRIQQARLLHNLGFAYKDRGLYNLAVSHLQQAHAIRSELGLRDQAANTLSVLGEVSLAQGDVAEGVALLERALAVFAETGNERGRGNALSDLGHAAWLSGDYHRAEAFAREALEMAVARGEPAGVATAALGLGRSLWSQGDRDAAEALFLQAAAAWESIGNRPGELAALGERAGLLWQTAATREDCERAEAAFAQLHALDWQQDPGDSELCGH